MIEFRACPRCRGDIKINRDMYGAYRECLQCGYILDIPTESKKPENWLDAKQKPAGKNQAA